MVAFSPDHTLCVRHLSEVLGDSEEYDGDPLRLAFGEGLLELSMNMSQIRCAIHLCRPGGGGTLDRFETVSGAMQEAGTWSLLDGKPPGLLSGVSLSRAPG